MSSEEDILRELASANAAQRLASVHCLSLAETEITTRLLQRLKALARSDPAPEVRAGAERALATSRARLRLSGDLSAANLSPQQVASTLAGGDTAARLRVLTVMQACDEPTLVPPVLSAIGREPDPRVLAKMIFLIGRLGSPEHLPLVAGFLFHPELKVQATAIEAIGSCCPGRLPDDLSRALGGVAAAHSSADVRFLARRIIGRGATRDAAASADAAPLSVEHVAAVMGGSGSDAKLEVLDRIQRGGDRRLAGPVAESLLREPDVRVVAKAIAALSVIGDRPHAESIKPYLKHADARVCANAVETLVALSGDEILPSLLPLLVRDDNRLRANLMIALYSRFPEQVMGYVRRMLRSERVSFRVSGLYCARFLDRSEMYRPVVDLLEHEAEPAAFDAALAWVEEHGPRERVLTDLEEVAVLRPDRAGSLRQRIERLRAAPPPPAPEPALLAPAAVMPGSAADPASPPDAGEAVPTPSGRPSARTQALTDRTPRGTLRQIKASRPDATGADGQQPGRSRAVVVAVIVGALAASVAVALQIPTGLSTEREEPRSASSRRTVGDATLRAIVTGSRLSGSELVLDVMLFGSPYRVRASHWRLAAPERGTSVWLVEPRLVREPDGSSWLVATDVRAKAP